ncbi:MAG: hypothetical protein JKY53_07185 [Flavobacteriales bacterium]|nr:hypothetical protein [Flavobacteriales bacterium]
MKVRLIFFALVLIILGLVIGSCFNKDSTIMVGGIQVNEADQTTWTNTLKKAGFNTVEVTVYAMQGDWDSDNFWFHEKDTAIATEIRAAKAEGLNVVLILRLAADHAYPNNKFLWHGMIMPKDRKTLESWFAKYAIYLDFWSKFAEKEGVDVLGIGSEMNVLTTTIQIDSLLPLEEFYLNDTTQLEYNKRFLYFKNQIPHEHLWVGGKEKYTSVKKYLTDRSETQKKWAEQTCFYKENDSLNKVNSRAAFLDEKWRELIAKTRQTYSGKLTYAANFDNYQYVSFWDDLDFIGINAYFKLKDIDKETSEEVFTNSWMEILDTITSFKKQHDFTQPVLFTELGYTYKNNCTVEPWNSHGFSVLGEDSTDYKLYIWGNEPDNYKERILAVKSLRKAIEVTNFDFAGALYWKFSTHDYHKEEAFMLHVSEEMTDSLQDELVKFAILPLAR